MGQNVHIERHLFFAPPSGGSRGGSGARGLIGTTGFMA